MFWDGYDKGVNAFEQFANNWLNENLTDSIVSNAVKYAFGSGGKRLRPMLLIAAAEACGLDAMSDNHKVMRFALAIELIHCYSLVHDDLPCMDNDDERRGKPSTHIKFGEANAVLAGDAMLNLAFEVMLEDVGSMSEVNAAKYIAYFAGINGMIDGQSIDINYEGTGKSEEQKGEILYLMHLKKTAALIRASLNAGVLLGGVSAEESHEIDEFGTMLGIAYQITDDMLDEGSEDNKLTFVNLYGRERAAITARDYINKAVGILAQYGDKYAKLTQLVQIINRKS